MKTSLENWDIFILSRRPKLVNELFAREPLKIIIKHQAEPMNFILLLFNLYGHLLRLLQLLRHIVNRVLEIGVVKLWLSLREDIALSCIISFELQLSFWRLNLVLGCEVASCTWCTGSKPGERAAYVWNHTRLIFLLLQFVFSQDNFVKLLEIFINESWGPLF